MSDWFIFHYKGHYSRVFALPFVWGRSPLWFTQLMSPFFRYLRTYGYWILACIDDFLKAPSPYRKRAGLADCTRARKSTTSLMKHLGLKRHSSKKEWVCNTVVEHLGVLVYIKRMRFFMASQKVEKVKQLARKLSKAGEFGTPIVFGTIFGKFLWYMCVAIVCYALVPVLHTVFVLGYFIESETRSSGSIPSFISVSARSALFGASYQQRRCNDARLNPRVRKLPFTPTQRILVMAVL